MDDLKQSINVNSIQSWDKNASAWDDLMQEASPFQLYKDCIAVLGHVDILVNNAGGYNNLWMTGQILTVDGGHSIALST